MDPKDVFIRLNVNASFNRGVNPMDN